MMYEVSSSSSDCSHGGRCGPDPTAGCGGRGALETSGARGPNSLPGLVAWNRGPQPIPMLGFGGLIASFLGGSESPSANYSY